AVAVADAETHGAVVRSTAVDPIARDRVAAAAREPDRRRGALAARDRAVLGARATVDHVVLDRAPGDVRERTAAVQIEPSRALQRGVPAAAIDQVVVEVRRTGVVAVDGDPGAADAEPAAGAAVDRVVRDLRRRVAFDADADRTEGSVLAEAAGDAVVGDH